jgi:hypothetical protein
MDLGRGGAAGMIVSRNEIESLALKAARGAGMSWGLAEEASVGAGWLADSALPWAGTLTALLAQVHTTSAPQVEGSAIAPSRPGTRLCPIMTGTFLSDLGPSAAPLEIRDVLAPLWLAPFLASREAVTRLVWGETSLLISHGAVAGADVAAPAALLSTFTTCVTMTREPSYGVSVSRPRGAAAGYDAPDEAWRALQQFEHRTYVPASVQSRLAGAGAGLLDND